LKAEAKRINQEILNLSANNYSVYVQNHDCVGSVRKEIRNIDDGIDNLVGDLPTVTDACTAFQTNGANILKSYKRNRQTLQHHIQLLELLEIPQLMDTCVRNEWYDQALDLVLFAATLERRHPENHSHRTPEPGEPAREGYRIVKDIVLAVRTTAAMMRGRLLQQLQTQILLPACLQIVGCLRRLDLSETSRSKRDMVELNLQREFLQCRDIWLQKLLAEIPRSSPYQMLLKVIEKQRMHLFDIITQYTAIFGSEPALGSVGASSVGIGGADRERDSLLSNWLLQKILDLVQILREGLAELTDVASLANVLEQAMFFGASLGRIGGDFRPLLPPLFESRLLEITNGYWADAAERMHTELADDDIEPPIVISEARVPRAKKKGGDTAEEQNSDPSALAPPMMLLAYPLLAELCNAVLSSLNDLRLCAILTLRLPLAASLQQSLERVVSSLRVYQQKLQIQIKQASAQGKGQAGGPGIALKRKEAEFRELCEVVALVLLPYLERCFRCLFPQKVRACFAMMASVRWNVRWNVRFQRPNPLTLLMLLLLLLILLMPLRLLLRLLAAPLQQGHL
jgi:hypothetical protein